nr:MAG TPA: hypothetical protein [Caudoviricetes sp.]
MESPLSPHMGFALRDLSISYGLHAQRSFNPI